MTNQQHWRYLAMAWTVLAIVSYALEKGQAMNMAIICSLIAAATSSILQAIGK